jgi:hypothetical protein
MQAVLPTPSPDSSASPASDAPRETAEGIAAVGQAPPASTSSAQRDDAPLYRAAPNESRHEATGPSASSGFADRPAAAEEAPTPAPLVWLDVTADDDGATLHSRLERANDARLGLVLAPDARVLRRPLDFRILARLAAELGLDLTVATADVERRRLAREFGLRVCAPPRGGPRWRVRRSTTAGALVAVAALAVAAAGLPRTAITLSPAVAPLAREPVVAVDLRPDAAGMAPGQLVGKPLAISFDLEQTRPTSGRETVGNTPAKGYATLHDRRPYAAPAPGAAPAPRPTAVSPAPGASGLAGLLGHNASGTTAAALAPRPEPPPAVEPPPAERVIPAGTSILANNGARYFTEAEVHLTPSGYATVPVVAEQPGRDANQPSGALSHLEDAQLADVVVENRLPLWGGTDRNLAIVAADDREALRQALQDRAQAEAPARLASLAGEDYLLVPETTTTTLEDRYDFAPGQQAAQLSAGATVRAQGIAVPRRAAIETAERQWRQQIPKGLTAVGATRLTGPPALREQDDEQLLVALPVEGQITPLVDPAALAAELRGQPTSAVRARLASLPGLQGPPRVDIWPSWAPITLRIDVDVSPPR